MKLAIVIAALGLTLLATACGAGGGGGQAATPVPVSATTLSPTGATGDEEFFNVDFWRSLIGVGTGALLGFGLALLGSYLLAKARRTQFARVVRNLIATESIYNLITLTNIEKRTRQTLDSDFNLHSYHEFRPRGRMIQQLMTPDFLSAISSRELGPLVVVAPELEHLAASYSEWVNTIADEDKPMAQEKTRIILRLTRVFGSNVLGLLIAICHRRDRDLLDENARRIAEKLSHIQVARPPDFTKSLRSSHLQDAGNREQIVAEKRYLVVWEHDWPECPIDVIELQQCVDPKVIRYSE